MTDIKEGKKGVNVSTSQCPVVISKEENSVAILREGEFGYARTEGSNSLAISTIETGDAFTEENNSIALVTETRSKALSEGANSVSIATGDYNVVSGAKGNALFLCERDNRGVIINTWSGIVGRGGIKPNIYYALIDGKLKELLVGY